MVLCKHGLVHRFHRSQLIQAVSPGLVLLFAEGAYTVGAVLYGIGKKKRYMHSVFHLFCLAGSLLHFLCILLFIL